MRKLVLLNVFNMLAMICANDAFAHGAVSYPISRQYQCKLDGNFWGAASAVPNAGCRASFEKSGYYPFIQWNEVSANPKPRHNQAALEQAVPNGALCAGGDKNKRGLDVPQNQGWKLTAVQAGTTIKHTWKLTAPHTPSYHHIYITKPGADFHNRELRWSDLDLEHPLYSGKMAPTTVTPDGSIVYSTDITIPANRSGKAMIYSIWQRDDAGNEAFLNCSDIDIKSNTVAPAGESKPVVTEVNKPAAQAVVNKPTVQQPAATKPVQNKPWKVPANATQIGETVEQPAAAKPQQSWKVPANAIQIGGPVYQPARKQ